MQGQKHQQKIHWIQILLQQNQQQLLQTSLGAHNHRKPFKLAHHLEIAAAAAEGGAGAGGTTAAPAGAAAAAAVLLMLAAKALQQLLS
jgi:hypothetical protein